MLRSREAHKQSRNASIITTNLVRKGNTMKAAQHYLCPLGNDIKAIEKDAWAFHMQRIHNTPYQGHYDYKNADEELRSKLNGSTVETLTLGQVVWIKIHTPHIVWKQAPDDANYRLRSPKKAKVSPRHFYGDFQFRGRQYHIEYFEFMSFGPISGCQDVMVFADGQFIGRGGMGGKMCCGDYRNHAFAMHVDDLLLTVYLDRKIASKKTLAYWKTVDFDGGVHIWARKETERQSEASALHPCAIPFDKLAACEHCARVDYKSNLTYVGMKHMVGTKVKRKSFLCGECLDAREKRRQHSSTEKETEAKDVENYE